MYDCNPNITWLPPHGDLLTFPQVANYFGVPHATLHDWCLRDWFPPHDVVRYGSKMWSIATLDAWREEQCQRYQRAAAEHDSRYADKPDFHATRLWHSMRQIRPGWVLSQSR